METVTEQKLYACGDLCEGRTLVEIIQRNGSSNCASGCGRKATFVVCEVEHGDTNGFSRSYHNVDLRCGYHSIASRKNMDIVRLGKI